MEFLKSRRILLSLATATAAVSLGIIATSGSAVASTHHSTTVIVPKTDVIGKGIFDCSVVTGEIGYSPPISFGGSASAHEVVSIWFQATHCTQVAGTKPVTPSIPKVIIGSISYVDRFGTKCPQISTAASGPFGKGVLNLAYNYPPAPLNMIDPSVAPTTSVQSAPNIALWAISGPVVDGSFVSPTFNGQIKPIIIGSQSCATGLTSEYITRGFLNNI